jgi:hypothetical protein
MAPPTPSSEGTSPGEPRPGAPAARVRRRPWADLNRRIGVLPIVLGPFAASKLIGIGVPMLTVWAFSPRVGVPPASTFISPFALWDGAAFAGIAQNGYPSGPLNMTSGAPGHLWAYFPGYPLLVHLASYGIPSTIVAGIVVSAVCELIALVFLAKLVLLERGDEASARFACWALALFPYAFYLSALYSESAFLAAATASLYYMRRGRDGAASVGAAAAMLVRVTGLALVPALVIEHLIRRRGRPGRGLVAICSSLLSPLLFVAYAWISTGDPLAYLHIEQSGSFNRVFAWPWQGASTTFTAMTASQGGNSFVFGMEMLFGIVGLAAVLWMAWHWRRIAPSFTVYATVAWLMGTSVIYWLSLPRYEMTVVPLYLVAVDLTRRHPRVRPVVLAASAGWMGFVATVAATGHFMA